MIETYKMWRLVRYLKNNQYEWIDWDHAGADLEGLVRDGSHLSRVCNISTQSGYPGVLRFVLTKKFGERPYWNKFHTDRGIPPSPPRDLSEEEKKVRNDFLEKSLADVQQRISDCIHKGFIGGDEEKQQLIFVTLKGRKFATPYGLIKEWMTEDIGEMRSVLGAIIGTAALIKWRAIWDFIHGIVLVVFSRRI